MPYSMVPAGATQVHRLVLRGPAGDHEAPQAVVVGLGGLGRRDEVADQLGEGERVVVVGEVSAPSKICSRLPGQLPCARIPVAGRDDRVPVAPHEQGRDVVGEVELVGRVDPAFR